MTKKRDRTRPRPIDLSPEQVALRDRIRAGMERWRNAPPGMPVDMASEFMARIMAGKTIRDLTNSRDADYMVSAERFKKHCELNPDWGAKVRRQSWENFRTKSRLSAHKTAKTQVMCLKGLHPMTPDNIRMTHKGTRRNCLVCWRAAFKNPPMEDFMPLVETIKQKLAMGVRLREIVSGPSKVAQSNKVYALRRTNPAFDQFVREQVTNTTVRSALRAVRLKTAFESDQRNDYFVIRALIPEGNPHRDDIVARIFEDMLAGSLKREDVPTKIKLYVKEMNNLFPTKYRKFGDSILYSLDEAVYEDGGATRADMVSVNLWGEANV